MQGCFVCGCRLFKEPARLPDAATLALRTAACRSAGYTRHSVAESQGLLSVVSKRKLSSWHEAPQSTGTRCVWYCVGPKAAAPESKIAGPPSYLSSFGTCRLRGKVLKKMGKIDMYYLLLKCTLHNMCPSQSWLQAQKAMVLPALPLPWMVKQSH